MPVRSGKADSGVDISTFILGPSLKKVLNVIGSSEVACT